MEGKVKDAYERLCSHCRFRTTLHDKMVMNNHGLFEFIEYIKPCPRMLNTLLNGTCEKFSMEENDGEDL